MPPPAEPIDYTPPPRSGGRAAFATASVVIGCLLGLIALAFHTDVLESLRLQLYFYAALGGLGVLFALIGFRRRGLAVAGLLLNTGIAGWKIAHLAQLIAAAKSAGWM